MTRKSVTRSFSGINAINKPKDTQRPLQTEEEGEEERNKPLPGREIVDTSALVVVCVNMNGLRTKNKCITLGKLMFDLWAGVCIVTETHLREEELGRVRIEHYHTLADYCRPTPIGERIGGGVIIIVHNTLTAIKENKIQGLAS